MEDVKNIGVASPSAPQPEAGVAANLRTPHTKWLCATCSKVTGNCRCSGPVFRFFKRPASEEIVSDGLPADMSLSAVLRRLYDSEINCGLSSFWDGGWSVWIGDDMNGRRADDNFDNGQLAEAAYWLHNTALRVYPKSEYARLYAGSADL